MIGHREFEVSRHVVGGCSKHASVAKYAAHPIGP